MTETAQTTPTDAPQAGLFARLVGVLVSPRDAYTAVAARPRALGALVVSALIMGGAQAVFFSTQVGKDALYEQQMKVIKALGITVTEQMAQQMEAGVARAQYTTPLTLLVGMPIFCVIIAGLVMAIFTAILGGGGTFKQVYAVVAHSAVISAVAQLFSLPVMYLREEMVSPTQLAVFFPMLPEDSFFTYLFSAIDLFYIWSLINLSIGIAVLYKRKTGPVASVLLGLYAVIAVIIAAVRAL